MPPDLTIHTPRFILRPFCENDLDALARINADPEAMKFLNYGKPLTRSETWRQIAGFLGHAQLRGYSMLAIEERATGQVLGRSGPWFPEGWPMLEVGWLVAPERQREGIATEAGRASLEWCFQYLGVDRVCSLIVPDNLASARVATKLGARIESRVDALFAVPVDVWVHRRPAAT